MAYTILLVDDSAIVRKVLMKTFGMTDISVNKFIQTENGRQGLDALRKEWVDLVFLDINMPEMNGLEFMRELRADPELSDTPVIIVSTEGSKARIDELNSLGIKAYLRKPVTPETLVETVGLVIGGMEDAGKQ